MKHPTLSILTLALCACGGGGGSSPPPPPPPPPSIAGIWNAPPTGTTVSVALVDDAGRIVGLTSNSNGCHGIIEGQLTVTASSFSGAGDVVFINNCTSADGSTGETWTDSGTFVEATSVSESVVLTTAKGAISNVNTSWAFDPTYDAASALSKLAGNWVNGTDTLTIDANGVMSEQDPTTGCVLSGQISIIDSTKNLYAVSMSWASCTGTLAVINGTTETGLGALYAQASPVEFLLVASGAVTGGTFVTGGVIHL